MGTTSDFWRSSQLAVDLYRVSHDENELRELERIEPIQT
jgi:plasmid maintenance system antidote protein VapI